MKMIIVLVLVAVCQLRAETFAQTVSISEEHMSIADVFREIKKQTGYNIICNSSIIRETPAQQVDLKNVPLETALKTVLAPNGLTYRITDKAIVVRRLPAEQRVQSRDKPEVEAAQRFVTGRVADTLGNPLSGVNVSVKGAQRGVTTDRQGHFQIPATQGDVLVFSLLGYQRHEVSIAGQDAIDVVLSVSVSDLDEVVVVGYGTQRKENLTGAVAQISGEKLQNRFVTNIAAALQGQVANLNITQPGGGGAPGAVPEFNIRGYTGFGGMARPLVVVDGVQVADGDLYKINVSDVESVSILKDAASAAIYGSSAPYGAILITTKKGKAGEKPTITYSNNFAFAEPIHLPEPMNSLDFANFMNEAAANSGASPIVGEEQLQRIKDYMDGKITEQTIVNPAAGVDGWMGGNANNNWFKFFTKDFSFSQQHNLGASGSFGKSNYYIGLGYLQKNGIYKYLDDKRDQYSARANLSSALTNWMTFNFRGSFFRYNTTTVSDRYNSSSGNLFNFFAALRPWEPFVYPNGARNVLQIYLEDGGKYIRNTDNGRLTGEFVFDPLPGWDITANYTYDGNYANYSDHYKTLTSIRPSGAEYTIWGSPNSFDRTAVFNQYHVVNVFTSYEKQLEGHYFKALAGYTQELISYMSFGGYRNNLYSDNLPSLSLSYGTAISTSESRSQLATRAWFGRINYNYEEKYLIEFNGRYDGTSRFLKDRRFKFYPGVSAAWLPSKEVFWTPIAPIVNSFKLRASYGLLGDQSIAGYYPFFPGLGFTAPSSSNWLFSDGRQSAVNAPGLVNPLLTWVTTTTLDFGIDVAFLQNRLNASFDWYKRSMDDYVGPAEPLPALLGTGVPGSNSTAVETKGFELTLGWQDRIGDFHYGLNAVWSDFRGFVTKYPNPDKLISTWYEGQEMGSIWGYETAGLFRSQEEIDTAPSQSQLYGRWTPGDVRYADLNGDNKIDWGENTLDNPGDRKVIGNTTPRHSYGLNLNAEYKGFDLAVFLQGIGKKSASWLNGQYFWGITGNLGSSSSPFVQQYDRWSEDNPDGYYPKYYGTTGEMAKNIQVQTRYLQDASYLRLKNLQLGYSLPVSWSRKIDIQKVRVFASGENLATLTKMIETIDPELSGTDGKIYPLQRFWTLGVNVTF
ncbi:TonB-dependent receptor [Parapedobacter sp. DT-150]